MAAKDEEEHKSRKEASAKKKEDSKRSHSEREWGRERGKESHREKEKEKEKKDRDYDHECSRRPRRDRSVDDKHPARREKHREKQKEKDKERERGWEDEREGACDYHRSQDKEDVEVERVREDRNRQKEKERLRERVDREREHEREKRERERENRDREKEKKRGRIWEREKQRHNIDRDDCFDDGVVRDHDRKRRRDDEYKEREHERRSKRHRDSSEDRPRSDDDSDRREKKTTQEENAEEDQPKLDEDIEKRRRRVQEWQELRRKQEESEREKLSEANAVEPKRGKAWTLEEESGDEEVSPEETIETETAMDENAKPLNENENAVDMEFEYGSVGRALQNVDGDVGDEEIDPLDAFMNSMVLPEVEKLKNNEVPSTIDDKGNGSKRKDIIHDQGSEEQPRKSSTKSLGRIIPGEDSDSDLVDMQKDDDTLEDEDDDEFMKRVKKTKVEKLSIVDHSKIDYIPFKKNFYIEVKEIARMSSAEAVIYRKQLELKIHGKDVPKPVKTWQQTGLTSKILETIKKLQFQTLMAIQTQALPVIMSGWDCIGVAKTGSGKTLAFVLPLLRHIKDQPPVVPGDGPIGLIMAPTRELVQQIHNDVKKFS